jgi:RsiW-degrading membrane proteinase PrsW (M82 family)
MAIVGRTDLPKSPRHASTWVHVFFSGLILWVLSVLVTGLTGNPNMIPTVILLGSFLVPATAVLWYLDHYQSATLSAGLVVDAFLVGGILGVLAASLLEDWLLTNGVFVYLGVGLIEELTKLLGLLFVARHLKHFAVRDGIVLGAAVGFGFAALESSGYAFTALIVVQGQQIAGFSLISLVMTELLRGILAPVGHGLWTAILGGALFAAARSAGQLRITLGVVAAYLLVAVFHALWDSMQGIAMILTALLTATPAQPIALQQGTLAPPAPSQELTFIIVQMGGLIVLSIVGLLVLWRRWRGSPAESLAEPTVGSAQGSP